MIETDEAAVRAKPTHQELERAIASVPGVEEAHVTLLPETGRSRLRIRLANGEDAPTVSWAIAATLRERFGIVLDPGAIRPRLSVEPAATDPAAPAAAASEATASDVAPPGDHLDDGGEGNDAVADAVAGDVGTVEHIDLGDESVVVIGDRILLSEAAREVLSEAIHRGGDADDHPKAAVPGSDDGPDAGPSGARSSRFDPAPSEGPQTVRSLSVVSDEAPTESDGGTAAPGSAESEAGRPDDGAVGASDDSEPRDVGASLEGPGRSRTWTVDEATLAASSTDDSDRGRPRAAIHHLDTRIDVSDVRVTATLHHRGRAATGESRTVPTRAGILRAVAEATVAALRQLTGDRLIVGVDSVSASVAGEPPMATVLVGVVTEAGEDTLVGAALVREDPERAVMRATLDALNRRVEPWLEVDLAG